MELAYYKAAEAKDYGMIGGSKGECPKESSNVLSHDPSFVEGAAVAPIHSRNIRSSISCRVEYHDPAILRWAVRDPPEVTVL